MLPFVVFFSLGPLRKFGKRGLLPGVNGLISRPFSLGIAFGSAPKPFADPLLDGIAISCIYTGWKEIFTLNYMSTCIAGIRKMLYCKRRRNESQEEVRDSDSVPINGREL